MSLDLIRSAYTGMVWPRLPAAAGATALAMQYQLGQTQWWPAARLEEHQLQQLQPLLRHAVETVPFYRERWSSGALAGGGGLTREGFGALPRLTRAEVQRAGQALLSERVPAAHGAVTENETSGSTGMPVKFRLTALTQLYWRAFNLRDHLWHGRDPSATLAAIRRFENRDQSGWGPSIDDAYKAGRSRVFNIGHGLDTQLDWLTETSPAYLISNSYNVYWLARRSMERGLALPGLRQALSFGGTLPDDAHEVVRRAWNVGLADVYTAEEVGYIALQCPVSGHYHVQSENLIVEILGDGGRPCAPGEIGTVVLTTLHNHAMPLIRYEIGDYAEAGGPCACGRGLPVIRRILGRKRNMLALPGGRVQWPSFPSDRWSHAAPVRQLQVIQESLELIRVRVVTPRELTREEEQEFLAAMGRCLGHPFRMALERVAEIPRGPGYKFEDFISRVPG
jgi:phenylacetate-CoA ligase